MLLTSKILGAIFSSKADGLGCFYVEVYLKQKKWYNLYVSASGQILLPPFGLWKRRRHRIYRIWMHLSPAHIPCIASSHPYILTSELFRQSLCQHVVMYSVLSCLLRDEIDDLWGKSDLC